MTHVDSLPVCDYSHFFLNFVKLNTTANAYKSFVCETFWLFDHTSFT